jgi:hypothetical protein
MVGHYVAGADNHWKEERFESMTTVATAASVQLSTFCAINSDPIEMRIICPLETRRITTSSLARRSEGSVSNL